MHKNLKLAVVIPARNEEKMIGKIVKGLQKSLNNSGYQFEIIVVDDGSTDDTADIARAAGAYIISHILGSGSGAATATGLSYAQSQEFDMAATIDADGQHQPTDIIKGVKVLLDENLDLLIGSRLINTAGMSKTKIIGNQGLSIITYILFGVRVTDSQSGLRIFSKQALESLKWKTSGYEFCSEMLWRARQLKLSIGEYPIKAIYTEYSVSKGQNNWNGINIIKSLLRRRFMEFFGE